MPRDEQNNKEKIIAAILKKVESASGFPALAANLDRVLTLSGRPQASAQELAQVILQDYGLTSRTLKIVNSAFYTTGKKNISTISRAVVLLGFNTIKDIATGMLVFEHFWGHSGNKAEIVDVATKSFLSAIQAREISILANYALPEEAFICSLLHRLGKMVVAVHCPREYEEMCRLQKKGRTEYEASQEVLGVSLPAIGRALAKKWQMPSVIWQTMDDTDGTGEKLEPGKEFLRTVSSISNKCVEKLCSDQPAGWQNIIAPLNKMVSLSEETVVGLLTRSADTATAISPMMNRSIRRMGFKRSIGGALPSEAAEASPPDDEPLGEGQETAPGVEDGKGTDAAVLMELMADVSNTLTTDYSLHQVYAMILETMYRGLGCGRVLFGMLTTDRTCLQGRYGLGRDIDDFIAAFRFILNEGGIVSDALLQSRDIVTSFEAISDPAFKRKFSSQLSGSTVCIYPLVVAGKPIGCFFAQLDASAQGGNAVGLQAMAILRNYGVLAIERLASRHQKA
ncbi:MAG: HDOD domain-containing protein [Pseudomonadota bacterium]